MRSIFLLLFILVSAPALASDAYATKHGERLIFQSWGDPGFAAKATLVERDGRTTICDWVVAGDDDMSMRCGQHVEQFTHGPDGFVYAGRRFMPVAAPAGTGVTRP